MAGEPHELRELCELRHTILGARLSALFFEKTQGLFVRVFRRIAFATGAGVCRRTFVAQSAKQGEANDGSNDDKREDFLCTDSHRTASRSGANLIHEKCTGVAEARHIDPGEERPSPAVCFPVHNRNCCNALQAKYIEN